MFFIIGNNRIIKYYFDEFGPLINGSVEIVSLFLGPSRQFMA